MPVAGPVVRYRDGAPQLFAHPDQSVKRAAGHQHQA